MSVSLITQEELRRGIDGNWADGGVAVLDALDVLDTLHLARVLDLRPKVVMLDPWYNKGVGGTRDDYRMFILELLEQAASITEHVFLWGFPEIVAYFVDRLPASLTLVAWLTWYYKNNPSVIRGWRSSQNACLHLARPGAPLYPQHFLNAAQRQKLAQGKLRYMPGPTSMIEEPLIAGPGDVIQEPLLVGFVKRDEQTGHPAQKPVAVFEKLILMTTQEGELVLDPMCGSGTTGAAVRNLGRRAILCDHSDEYIRLTEARLGVTRVPVHRRG
jgi:site-specific DNA-methyltransferase (adenine-specific)